MLIPSCEVDSAGALQRSPVGWQSDDRSEIFDLNYSIVPR